MPAKTTPQRLREIIDLLGKATTFAQQKAVRDTLTADELTDYEAWTQNLPGAVQPAPAIQTTPQRLRQIIDLLGKATTFAQQKAVRDALTADETEDYEAWTQGLPGAIQPATTEGEWVSEARYIGRIPTLPAPPQVQPTIKPTLIIARTPYPKWWKDLQTAAIDIDTTGTEIIILPNPNFYLYIATIVLTVDGETDITFSFGVFGNSGAMDFGGDGEPKGIVIAMGNSPTSCGTGSFQITSSGAGVHVGGFVSYYRESVKET